MEGSDGPRPARSDRSRPPSRVLKKGLVEGGGGPRVGADGVGASGVSGGRRGNAGFGGCADDDVVFGEH